MPLVNKALPTLPSLCMSMEVRWVNQVSSGGGVVNIGRTVFYFQMDGATFGGFSKFTLALACRAWWTALVDDWHASGVAWIYFYVIMNDAGTYRSVIQLSQPNTADHGAHVEFQLVPCWLKYTSVPGRNGVGRNYMPPIPASFIAGNSYTAAGYAALQDSAARMLHPIVDQGVTYTPSMYFPSMLSLVPINSVRCLPRPTQLYRRRIRHFASVDQYLYPLVG